MLLNDNTIERAYLKNGNNTRINNFSILNNPDLKCIQVDDVAFANGNANWTKDATASFNTYCPPAGTLSVDKNFLNESIGMYPNPATSTINISVSNGLVLKSIEIYNLVGKKIEFIFKR